MSSEEQVPTEGLQERMQDVLEELYTVGGYASITWQVPDKSFVSISRSAATDEPVTAVVS